VCYYATDAQFDVLYLDMWRNHYTRDVTTKIRRAENKYGNKSGAILLNYQVRQHLFADVVLESK
jgi:hypothetical protein